MRSRRRRRGRVEPIAWARACGQWQIEQVGERGAFDCDESLVAAGLVLFDPSAFVATGAELRTTVRRIHWPTAMAVVTNLSEVSMSIWLVVVKTNRTLADFVGLVSLGDVLNGTFDVLDVKVFSQLAFQQAGDSAPHEIYFREAQEEIWDIKAQRKLDVGETIVCLGFFSNSFPLSTLPSTTVFAVAFNTALSVLFQRTLT